MGIVCPVRGDVAGALSGDVGVPVEERWVGSSYVHSLLRGHGNGNSVFV